MNNKIRQQKRFERDRKRRLEKRLNIEQECCSYDNAISIESLTKAFYGCRKGVAWKRSVQNFEENLFQNISVLHNKMAKCQNVSKGYVEFEIIERGKKRRIQACHISERVVQKSFAENVLSPMLDRTLIKNNCASQAGKGTHKAWEYFEGDLKQSYRKWGRDFYIIQGDFHNYFASIPHDKLITELDKYFHDERTRWYYREVINSFQENGKPVGLGLGSQMCQNFAVFYPNKLDHYMERIGRCGRFNDDFYLIVHTKEDAKEALDGIRKIVSELELELNDKKTHIVKATHTITYLKTKFNLLSDGRILKRPSRKGITHERQKLKRMKKIYNAGALTFRDVWDPYMSWRGSLTGKKCFRTKQNMNKLFNHLFLEEWMRTGGAYG